LTKQQIQEWFERIAELLEIDIQEVSYFESLNYLALNTLQKDDWIRRSPCYGDILFNMWQKDQPFFTKAAGTKERDEGIQLMFCPLPAESKNLWPSKVIGMFEKS
jgi:hypothetical protein